MNSRAAWWKNGLTTRTKTFKQAISELRDVTEHVAVLKAYSYVLIGEDKETIADLYLVDDDTIVISGELMKGLSEDLDHFWEELSNETQI